MSIESVVDVVVHLGNFKTFDMLAQGTYRLQIKVFYRSRSQQKTYAQPYLILDNRFSQNGISQKLFEPTINPKDNSVLTSSFFIRFCDQESLLNQIAMFRMEVNDPKATSQEAFIEMALLSLEIGESKEMKSVVTLYCRTKISRPTKKVFKYLHSRLSESKTFWQLCMIILLLFSQISCLAM